jgi:chromosome segregation ATPase
VAAPSGSSGGGGGGGGSVSSLSSLEALDLGVMELRVARSEAERKHMEVQLKSSMSEMDDLRERVETLQEKVDETRAEGAKQKQRTRAVARIAVKKQKITKAEVHRLRDQMDGMRKEWMSPQVKKELKNQLEKGKKKLKV